METLIIPEILKDFSGAASEMNEHYKLALNEAGSSAKHIIAIGKLLVEVKRDFRGNFEKWIREHCEFSPHKPAFIIEGLAKRAALPAWLIWYKETNGALTEITKINQLLPLSDGRMPGNFELIDPYRSPNIIGKSCDDYKAIEALLRKEHLAVCRVIQANSNAAKVENSIRQIHQQTKAMQKSWFRDVD